MAELKGANFRALRRLSTRDNVTIANEGETCEKVPAAPGGTVSQALEKLLASGKIEPVDATAAPVTPAPAPVAAPRLRRRQGEA